MRTGTLALLLALPASAQEPSGPLGPREAAGTLKVPPGFRVELVAAEPDVMDPVALAFDSDGRIYVAEMADYPLGPPSGRIRLLEDLDGDGRAERSRLFASGIPYPTGVLPWRDGVLVTAAPDILFLKDTDGDGKADVREVVFTGFVEGNQQHRVNGLQFTIDNWIQGSNGDSGGNLRRGDQPDAKRLSISGRDFRFRPDYGGLEPASGHAQYANTFDDWGNRFINDNSNHIRHPVLPLGYLARNPALRVPAVEEMISDHGGSARVFPSSRLQERPNDHHAANHFTSACSVTIYRADSFPPAYRGSAFVCEPVHNLVHRDVLVPKGASFVARRGEENAEFLASSDNWFRPVNLYAGPDGALYVVDMYRLVIEHPQWIPLEMQKRVDLRAGHDRGRIYRVVHESARAAPRPRLGTASAKELAAHLESGNAWWRTTAQRLLVERQDKGVLEELRRLARGSTSDLGRLHALWTLSGLGALNDGLVKDALADPAAGIREHALRLAEGRADLREAVLAMADDPSPRVRFQVALTLGGIPDPRATAALARIAVRDAADRWTRIAVLSSVPGGAARLLAAIRAASPDFLERAPAGAFDLLRQLGDLAGGSRRDEETVEWLRLLAEGAGAEPARWRLVALSSLAPALRRRGAKLEGLLEKAGVDAAVQAWTARLLEAAVAGGRDVTERVNAIDLLALLPTAASAAELEKLLRPQEPQEVQVAVVRALASAPGDPVGTRILDGWARFTGPVRREILGILFSRPEQAPRLLDRLEKGEIRVVELEAGHRDQLLRNPSAPVRQRARKLLESKGSAEVEEMVATVTEKVLPLKGDRTAGEKVYMTSCAACHRLHGQGFNVGPGLQAVAGRDKRALLADVLNPNRAIDPKFQQYVVKTAGQAMITGVVAAETPASITLRRAQGEEATILRQDILEIKAWPASMMPEGLQDTLSAQNFADLLEFLGAKDPEASPRKAFAGNAPETVKPEGDGTLVLPASKCEIRGSTLVFESKHRNLGHWSSEDDRATWAVDVPREGRYAVELDWACESGTAGRKFVLSAGAARLTGTVPGTGSWDEYKQERFGTIRLPAGRATVTFRSEGSPGGALIDLRTVRLIPAKD